MSPRNHRHPVAYDDTAPTDNPRRRFGGLISWRRRGCAMALLGLVTLLLAPALPAGAVHDLDLFELDGNAIDEATAGDDWDTPPFPAPGNAFAFTGIIPDTFGQGEDSSFTGGGSKDVRPISEWQHATMSVPTKTDLTNAYAAAYVDPSGDVILYYGADRFDADAGATTLGFWFFQEEVALDTGGTFSGEHQVGDILVVADFTNGGMDVTIDVYRWDGTEPVLVLTDAMANCGNVIDPQDNVCAIVNLEPTPAPWPYTNLQTPPGPPTGGVTTTFPPFAFFEGGINLSEIFRIFNGGGVPCFSSFLAETRSAPSINATLQDFVLGGFELCDLDVEKTADALSKVGDPVDYTITITNSGLVELFVEDITDSLVGDIVIDGVDQANPAVTSNDCGVSLLAGASCTIKLTRTVLETDPDPLVNTVNVTFNTAEGLEGVSFTRTAVVPTELFTAGVTVDKTGPAQAQVGDTVTYTITVTNTSSEDAPDLILDSIDDSLLGDITAAAPAECATLAFGESCQFTVDRAVLGTDPDPLVNTVEVLYHPEDFTNDVTDEDGHIVDVVPVPPVEEPYDDDYPGDPDFDFDTPFDDTDDTDDPAPTTDTGGEVAGTNQEPTGDDQLQVAGDTVSPQPAPAGEAAPVAVSELPRTGASIRQLTMAAGMLLIIGGLASLARPRRRKAHHA